MFPSTETQSLPATPPIVVPVAAAPSPDVAAAFLCGFAYAIAYLGALAGSPHVAGQQTAVYSTGFAAVSPMSPSTPRRHFSVLAAGVTEPPLTWAPKKKRHDPRL